MYRVIDHRLLLGNIDTTILIIAFFGTLAIALTFFGALSGTQFMNLFLADEEDDDDDEDDLDEDVGVEALLVIGNSISKGK
jgi:hypothetical protein